MTVILFAPSLNLRYLRDHSHTAQTNLFIPLLPRFEGESSSSLDGVRVGELPSDKDDGKAEGYGIFLLFFLFPSLASLFACICIEG